MKILLATLNAKYIHSNLAIRILYSLNKDYADLAWKEFTIKENKDEIAAYCAPFDVVAFSCYIWNFTQTLSVIQKIKALNPHIKIMLGGPEVSYEWEPVIAMDEIDYIVIGEGETPFQQFIQAYPNINGILGIVHKQNEQIHYLPTIKQFDLNELVDKNPYQYDPPTDLFNKVLYIETSRGCPYKCEFCLASLDNKVRYLPMADIKLNLLHMMQHGRVIKFLDRTFNVKKDFTLEIFQFILDHHQAQNVFQFEITADILHPDIIQFIKDKVPKGLFRFEIGIQTVNQLANLEVSRKQNFLKTKEVIEQVQDKIEMHLDLIVGLPLDYWGDIKYSVEEVFKLFAPELQLGFLKFLKGTPMRDKHQQHEYKYDALPPYQIISSKYLTENELHRITLMEFGLEAYWNKKRIIHTLKYVSTNYSAFDFLLGIGELFGKTKDYHRHTLKDLFEIVHEYINIHHAEDRILKQLLAIDYSLQHKVKPGAFIIPKISKEQKNEVVQQLQLPTKNHRYLIFALDFDFTLMEKNQEIVHENNIFIIQYDGVHEPVIVAQEKINITHTNAKGELQNSGL